VKQHFGGNLLMHRLARRAVDDGTFQIFVNFDLPRVSTCPDKHRFEEVLPETFHVNVLPVEQFITLKNALHL